MNGQFDNFLNVLDALQTHNVEYVLIGGIAAILHGIDRLTRDIDIFVKMDDSNIERLRNALHSIFDDESINEITLEELQTYAVIRYGTPDDFYIDIMARLGEVAVYEDLAYEILNYQGVQIRLATPQTLYDLKEGTLRYKDKFDAAYLKELINKRQSDISAKKNQDKE
jgi:hypothetical protein